MSAATDGFSAMMSFLPMPRERPQMIIAKDHAVQPPPRAVFATRARARAREPVERLADVRIFEAGRRQLARNALAVIGQLGLLAVLEQVNQDVVHSAPFL